MEKYGELFVSDTLTLDAFEKTRRHQNDANAGLRQSLVDLAHERRSEGDVLLAKPDSHTASLKEIVQLLSGSVSVVPCMAEEYVAKVRNGRSRFHVRSCGFELKHLSRCIPNG